MLKDLIKVSNSLDAKGFKKEADELDRIIRKLAQDWQGPPHPEGELPEGGAGNQYFSNLADPYRYFHGMSGKFYYADKDGDNWKEVSKPLAIKAITDQINDGTLEVWLPAHQRPRGTATVSEEGPALTKDEEEASTPEGNVDTAELQALLDQLKAENPAATRLSEDNEKVQRIAEILGKKRLDIWKGIGMNKLERIVNRAIKKANKGNSANDALSAEASRSEKRISKFASLISGEFSGLAKSVRR